MSAVTQPFAPPVELVLASAGTGKTFHISSRIIGLLASGHPPESIFAATFTRKAAGEITDRVLERLADAALDEERARELSKHALDGMGAEGAQPLDRAGWLEILRLVTRNLHRLEIGTLDSYFMRAALGFSHELELPPGWQINDEAAAGRLRAEALQDVLAHTDRGAVVEMVRGLARGGAQRSVHDGLLDTTEALLALHFDVDSDADAWAGFDELAAAAGAAQHDREQLAQRLRSAEVPQTAGKVPDARWVKAVNAAADALAEGLWEELFGKGLGCAAITDDPSKRTYYRKELPDEIRSVLEDAAALARAELAPRLAAQCRALERLAERYGEALARRQREAGGYRFDDLTRAVGGDAPLARRPDLFYRLDAQTLHLLLDEFQDTSRSQWRALEALADALLHDSDGSSAAVVVADPKQSIYGWRGGEPRLVGVVADRYRLQRIVRAKSYRSSQTVLDFVNRIFSDLTTNTVMEEVDAGPAFAARWSNDYNEHEAAKALPGHVRIVAGPRHENRKPVPEFWQRTGELVERLWRDAPGASIGVLTSTNAAVGRIIFELRRLGVPASEEGGNPLTDSAAVASLLALLRLADHPGDRVSRYHVAHTPVGLIAGVNDHADDAAAARAAHTVRRRLLEDGYGQTLAAFAERIERDCDARELRRVQQLVELGFRYDAQATLRVRDFISLVESERIEDPVAAPVRVMTVHQAKGLEFDTVVLPQLDRSLCGRTAAFHAYRPEPAGAITRIFPHLSKDLQPLFHEMDELRDAVHQSAEAALQDAIGGLYVALTRARHAVHILIGADGDKMSTAKSGANLVRHALGLTAPAADGEVLYESGDFSWHRHIGRDATVSAAEAAAEPTAPPRAGAPAALLRPSAGRNRMFVRIRPSDLAHTAGPVDLRALLRLDRGATDRGTLAHAWFEQVEWLEDGVPAADQLRSIAATTCSGYPPDATERLLGEFREWLAAPQIASVLSRASYPAGATVLREQPVLHRDGDALMEGVIDRLVLLRDAQGSVTGADILDYKSDAVDASEADALDTLVVRYRPQLGAYRRGVAAMFGIEREGVKAKLVILAAGAVINVE